MKNHTTTSVPEAAGFLTKREAAKLAKVSMRTISNWMAAKAITAIRIGRVVRFDRETLLAELRAFSR